MITITNEASWWEAVASGKNWPNSDNKSSWFWNSLDTCPYTSVSVSGIGNDAGP